MLVVDPSAILGLVMEDEVADYAEAVLSEIEKSGGLAPSIFWYELRNVLVVNERSGRITVGKTNTFLALLAELPIELAALPSELGVLDLARDHRLTVYDAAYLDLASRSGASLATLDKDLLAATQEAGVSLFSADKS